MKKPITIEAPQYGLAPSALQGFAEIRNLDITSKPGVCFPAFAMANDDNTSPLVVGKIIAWATPDDIDAYGIGDDADGVSKCYKRTTKSSYSVIAGLTAAGMLNIVYYKGYMAVIYTNKIEWIDVSDDSIITTLWTAGTITSGGYKAAIVAQDDALYISAQYGLDKISENSGETFDPASGTTFTVTKVDNVIKVPELIEDIDEIANSLIIQADKKLYFWGFVETDVDSVIKVNKNINKFIAYNNLIYFQAGYGGEWFISNGTTVEPFTKLPLTLLSKSSDSTQINITNIVLKDELLYFGVYAGGGSGLSPIGIYSLNPRNKAIVLAHTLSTGQEGTDEDVLMGGLIAFGSTLVMAYSQQDGESAVTYHVDHLSTTRVTGDKAYFITQLFRLGSKDNKENIAKIDLQLSKPQASGDSVKVYKRPGITGSFTQIGTTWDTDDEQSTMLPAVNDIESIQFKVVLNDEAEYYTMTLYYI